MRIFVAIILGLAFAGSVQGSDFEQWQEHEFEDAYAQVKQCLPFRMEWASQSSDEPMWAELESREGGTVLLRTPVWASSSPDNRQVIVIVDEGGDGTIDKVGGEGYPLRAGADVSQDPLLNTILHTVVGVAVRTGQACD